MWNQVCKQALILLSVTTLAAFSGLAVAEGVATPRWVTPVVRAPRLEQRIFDSAAAKTKVSYFIYTPEQYDTEKERRFPVLYWLHGTGGGVPGVPNLVAHFDAAIRAGKTPPMLVVFPNGMATSMWCDSKDGSVPMETVVVKELVPLIDANFRTIATRESRLIEGFSMGGYGAARFGFKHHDVFGAVSILAGGPFDLEFKGPRAVALPEERERILQSVYGGDLENFKAQSPWVLAEQNAAALRSTARVRFVVGERDGMLRPDRALSEHLEALNIPHTFTAVPGVEHKTMDLLNALGESNWEFYRAVFGGAKTLLIFGRPDPADPAGPERNAKSVQEVADAFNALPHDSFKMDRLTPEQVSVGAIEERLAAYARSLKPDDTFVIYSHTHGTERGIVLDSSGPTRTLSWADYADVEYVLKTAREESRAQRHEPQFAGEYVTDSVFISTSSAKDQPRKDGSAPRPLVFDGVTVIDTVKGVALPERTVVIVDGRIAAVGLRKEVVPPPGAEIVDASGKYLIPGLWDMHTHPGDGPLLPQRMSLLVANGVTGIRQVGTEPVPGTIEKLELAPRVGLAGYMVNGPQGAREGSPGRIATADEARAAVHRAKELGYDFVKVHAGLSREAFFAIVAEAKKLGLTVAGHVQSSVSAAEASDAGQRSVEHLTGVLEGISSVTPAEQARMRMSLREREDLLLDKYDETRARALFERFVQNDTWQCPTLVVPRMFMGLDDPEFLSDPRLRFVPAGVRAGWQNAPSLRAHATAGPEWTEHETRRLQSRLKLVGSMQKAGVKFLAGTDSIIPYIYYGFSLHDELDLFVQAGLSPADALRTATLNPAEFLGRLQDFGTVEPGRMADLVLLDGDPFKDIGNVRRIAAVVLGGRLFSKAELDTILAKAETTAKRVNTPRAPVKRGVQK